MKTDIFDEFRYLCYQLDYAMGKGSLIDSDFLDSKYDDDKLSLQDIKTRLIKLKDMCEEVEDNAPNYTRTYLKEHIDALIMQIDLKFEKVDYIDAINTLYNIKVKAPSHNIIEELHFELNDLLNKCGYTTGTLNDRVHKWDNDNKMNAVDFIELVKQRAKEYANIVKKDFKDIIDFNSFKDKLEFKVVDTNSGWGAYNYYINNYSGIIEFNSGISFNKYSLDKFISHEGYPGHHTSCLIKEYLYKEGKANKLVTINLLNTPSSLIEEGIGDSGLRILNQKNDDINYKIEETFSKLSTECFYFAAYEYINNNKKEEEIIKILINDKLHANEKSANRAMQFIKNWGYYVPTYKFGKETVEQFILEHPENFRPILYNACSSEILKKNN